MGLYPALEAIPTSVIAYESVKKSRIKFRENDYNQALVFLLLMIGRSNMIKIGLGPFTPLRKEVDFTAKSLNAKKNRSLEGWTFTKRNLDDVIKREIIARVIQICTLILMTTQAYQFGGRIFRQKLGAPIGLRASAVLAKLCMACWDVKWAKMQTAFGLVVHLMFRYMDDIRVYLHPIRACWEWTGMGWMKKDPDSMEISEEKRTEWSKEQIKSSFEGIFGFLKFTTEDQEEFNNKMLPTLDVQTRVENDGKIYFEYYQKPMVNNMLLDINTVLSK